MLFVVRSSLLLLCYSLLLLCYIYGCMCMCYVGLVRVGGSCAYTHIYIYIYMPLYEPSPSPTSTSPGPWRAWRVFLGSPACISSSPAIPPVSHRVLGIPCIPVSIYIYQSCSCSRSTVSRCITTVVCSWVRLGQPVLLSLPLPLSLTVTVSLSSLTAHTCV